MIDAQKVHEVLARHQLADGLPIVFDLERSHGSWVHDARTGEEYLDAFTCFASWPVGYNHPMLQEAAFQERLLRAATTKVTSADLYTREMAEFVAAFATRVTPEGFPYHFWISGGALAVENALKTAFDWKARKLGRTDFGADVNDLVVLHFENAFHGRSGYTLSLTNTVPDKVGLFPKFPWPRVPSPAIEYDLDGNPRNDVEAAERASCAAIEAAFARHAGKVAAILIEPIQGEGGDRHFRPEFMRRLRQYADEEEALLIFDEVQTGFFGTGEAWMWQHHGVRPDVVAFGKKTQVCGIYASRRVDEVADNVFHKASRINSTWGGNLVDMVRCHRFIEIVEADALPERIAAQGARALAGFRAAARESGAFDNVRGLGSWAAFDLRDGEVRRAMLAALREERVLALPSGPRAIRFRLPLVISEGEVDELVQRTARAAARLG